MDGKGKTVTRLWQRFKDEALKYGIYIFVANIFFFAGQLGTKLFDSISDEVNALGIPEGAIIAFERKGCSGLKGWEDVAASKFAGRFLIVAGEKQERTKGHSTTARPQGTFGGAEVTVLKLNQVPGHGHDLHTHVYRYSNGPLDLLGLEQDFSGGIQGDREGTVQPFSIMPPYIAMTYCKRS